MTELTTIEGELVDPEPQFTIRNVVQTIGDVVAAHYVGDTIRPGEDRTRITYGAVTAALLYATAPFLKKKIQELPELDAEDLDAKDAAIVAGFAGLGGLIAYYTEPQTPIRLPEDVPAPRRPRPLVTGLSSVYLAASLLDPTRSPEFKTRQRAGIGGGLIAYVAGPDVVQKVGELTNEGEAPEIRRAVVGGVVGATGGAMIRYVTR